jgi:hypothetical protein
MMSEIRPRVSGAKPVDSFNYVSGSQLARKEGEARRHRTRLSEP